MWETRSMQEIPVYCRYRSTTIPAVSQPHNDFLFMIDDAVLLHTDTADERQKGNCVTDLLIEAAVSFALD